MRKQQLENAAFEVATQVRTVEETIDSALAEIAELQSRVMRANALARAGVGTVHGTLEQLATAFNGLVASRGAIVACHAALVEAKGKVPGLRVTSWGDGDDCPEFAQADLRIVA
jgi:prophage DNA circulation protein